MQATYEAITALTDAFCREHLNEDYAELARRNHPAAPKCSEPARVRLATYLGSRDRLRAPATTTFLTHPSTQPYMTTADLCAGSGSARAR